MLILLTTLLTVTTAERIAQQNPALGTRRVQQLAAWIDAASRRHDVPAEILTNILAQESTFRRGISRCYGSILNHLRVSKITCDMGIAQINLDGWGRDLRLDPCRLKYDDAYSIDQAARILSIIKRRDGLEPNWWSRYHDNRPSKRAIYEALVLARAQLDN
jgi:hypothetical protein